jgi:hypothetical protein
MEEVLEFVNNGTVKKYIEIWFFVPF